MPIFANIFLDLSFFHIHLVEIPSSQVLRIALNSRPSEFYKCLAIHFELSIPNHRKKFYAIGILHSTLYQICLYNIFLEL